MKDVIDSQYDNMPNKKEYINYDQLYYLDEDKYEWYDGGNFF